ncbi:RDD family protein [Candidatus Bathyarchaeota archaeon]|nr:RDD family protein [Candidatus Bathyarchaeota archaeon]
MSQWSEKRRINIRSNILAERGSSTMPHCKNCGSEMPEDAAYCQKCGAPVQAASGVKLAFWGERFVAWLIDVIILSIAIELIKAFVWAGWPGFQLVPGFPTWIPFVDFGLGNIVRFLYWMLMEGAYGQSLGKMLMRIKATRLDGSPMNMGQAALQSLGKAFLLPLDCLLGWILYLRRRQRLFNYLSETIVVKT